MSAVESPLSCPAPRTSRLNAKTQKTREDFKTRENLRALPGYLARARVLIASDSSFSLAAAVLSHGLVLHRDGWKRFAPAATSGMLHAVTLDDDGGLDCAAALPHWREAAIGVR